MKIKYLDIIMRRSNSRPNHLKKQKKNKKQKTKKNRRNSRKIIGGEVNTCRHCYNRYGLKDSCDFDHTGSNICSKCGESSGCRS